MTTRIAHTAPVSSGLLIAGYQAWQKAAAYLALLAEVFAEAKAQARAAQARGIFIEG
jgi:hypothetical protein